MVPWPMTRASLLGVCFSAWCRTGSVVIEIGPAFDMVERQMRINFETNRYRAIVAHTLPDREDWAQARGTGLPVVAEFFGGKIFAAAVSDDRALPRAPDYRPVGYSQDCQTYAGESRRYGGPW